ncbi:hypothetical protein CMV_017937 [Castanea mollissima]|uniref:Uncharacterized protein n=1 Tax=Castanea mollissima TaxID=60419 RepID=A0A8J4QSA3_9ROSI|nr:hypothetical protein CMV_017937 [Castanea mollissima]
MLIPWSQGRSTGKNGKHLVLLDQWVPESDVFGDVRGARQAVDRAEDAKTGRSLANQPISNQPQTSAMEAKEVLNGFKVGSLPTLIYIPDFISESEQTMLLNNVYGAPASKWKSLKNRRLQNWGGVVHEKGLLLPQEC